MELKPCPFCGAVPSPMPHREGKESYQIIQHKMDCKLMGMPSAIYEHEYETWNHRPIENKLNAEVVDQKTRVDYVRQKGIEGQKEILAKIMEIKQEMGL